MLVLHYKVTISVNIYTKTGTLTLRLTLAVTQLVLQSENECTIRTTYL